MRAAIILALVLSAASAAELKSAPPKQWTLTVDAADLENIGAVLPDLPKKIADPLIAKLQAQINAQNAANTKKTEPSKPIAPRKKK